VGYRGSEFEGVVVDYSTRHGVFAHWTLRLDDDALVHVDEPLKKLEGDPLLTLMGRRVKATLQFKEIQGEIVDFYLLSPV
jgi:hypothetical protein